MDSSSRLPEALCFMYRGFMLVHPVNSSGVEKLAREVYGRSIALPCVSHTSLSPTPGRTAKSCESNQFKALNSTHIIIGSCGQSLDPFLAYMS